MITTKDSSLTVYPNRQQMLALIQARASARAGDGSDESRQRRSAAPDTPLPPDPVCVPLF